MFSIFVAFMTTKAHTRGRPHCHRRGQALVPPAMVRQVRADPDIAGERLKARLATERIQAHAETAPRARLRLAAVVTTVVLISERRVVAAYGQRTPGRDGFQRIKYSLESHEAGCELNRTSV